MTGELVFRLVCLVNAQSFEVAQKLWSAHDFQLFDFLRDRVHEVVVIDVDYVIWVWRALNHVGDASDILIKERKS